MRRVKRAKGKHIESRMKKMEAREMVNELHTKLHGIPYFHVLDSEKDTNTDLGESQEEELVDHMDME